MCIGNVVGGLYCSEIYYWDYGGDINLMCEDF